MQTNIYTHTSKHIKFKMPKERFNNRRKRSPNVDKDSRIVVMWSQVKEYLESLEARKGKR